ncbi:MAG TPA: hypothetical protein PKJ16_07655 [Spirochaetota bacterium]|nr:hypothetical protein [Spirochaetota bacterium]
MDNIRYHAVNTVAVIIFAYITAITINQVIRFVFAPTFSIPQKAMIEKLAQPRLKPFEEYKSIVDSGFFKIPSETPDVPGVGQGGAGAESVNELLLLGTITGPSHIARALIKKKTEKDPQIFRLYGTVHGHKLIRIDNSKVYLKTGNSVQILDMFAKEGAAATPAKAPSGTGAALPTSGKVVQNLSKAELQQKVLNNVDNALQGIRAGPYRVDGAIKGYKIFRIKPHNIMYKLGARNGDVLMRVNGHAIDSTEKLLSIWKSVQGDSKISVDLERGGKLLTFDFNITE